jgi:signal peptidase II
MGDDAPGGGVRDDRLTDAPQAQMRSSYLWGPLSGLGLITALAAVVADQASKLWLLFVYDLGGRQPVAVTPFLDLVLVWNRGISYGLFQQDGPIGQWALLAVKIVAVVLLWAWLARSGLRLTAVSLGLIIGGALGNAIDRFSYGAVADFVLLHLTTATWSFNWYVFNLADVAIVAGVAGLLYESILGDRAAKAP